MAASNTSSKDTRPRDERANAIYYLQIGVGTWSGDFRFSIKSWHEFWADSIGLKNRFLTLSMVAFMKLFGDAKITSRLEGFPDRGQAGVATNVVRVTKFGVTVYLLSEEYVLHPDGRQVYLHSRERFGPIPFLFNNSKEYGAEILDSGMGSIYYMPLLGADWVARYTVRADRDHIDSRATCKWGESHEVIHRVR